MVRNATTVAGVTSNWNTEYTPTTAMTSCTIAAKAAMAIRHSKRTQMNSDTAMKNTTSARIAFSVISCPQVELVKATLTAPTSTSAATAKSAVIAAAVSLGTSSI